MHLETGRNHGAPMTAQPENPQGLDPVGLAGAARTLIDAIQRLSLARDLPTVQEIVRTTARTLTGADGATFVLRDGDRCFYADEDAVAPLWKGKRFPLSTCISGWAMLNARPVVIEDIYADPRIPADAYRPTFVKSLAMVPIRTSRPIGAIGNYWAVRRLPTPQEVELLQALADATSIAIENVELYRSLENRVRERTEELEAANKDLESFSYSVSHDLRAPLRAILGFSQMLQEDHGTGLDAEGRRLLDVVGSSALRMDRLIEDLLQFAQSGRQPVRAATFDPKPMVDEVLAELLRGSTRKVETAVGNLPPLWGDPALLRQVFVNLLSNAVKYTGPRETARIEVGGREETGETVCWVKDNGVGFPPDQASRLFGVFQRLHGREFEGTGVGLALAHRILQRHGGRIEARSAPEQGATFTFTLPNRGTALSRPP